jgi:outer membrane protein
MKPILPERTFPVAPDAANVGSQKIRFTYILPLLVIFFILHPLTALTKQGQPAFYTLHVISCRQMESAVEELSRFQQLGIPVFYRHEEVKDKGMWYRVYIGEYTSSREARKAGEKFKQRGLISYARVRRFKPEVEPAFKIARFEAFPSYAELKKSEEKQPEPAQPPKQYQRKPEVAPALGKVYLTLFEAIRHSFEGNHDIRVVSHLPNQAQEELTGAESVYDASLFLDSTHGETYGPWRTSQAGAPLDNTLAQKESQVKVGVKKPLTTGGSLSVYQEMDYFDSKSLEISPDSKYASAPSVEFTQPLLKGMGSKAERADISIANLKLDISQQEFHRTVIDVANRVSQVYWQLFLARELVAISQQAFDMAEEVHRREATRYAEGISKQLDVDRARAAAEDRRSNILRAKERVQVEMDQLKFLLNWSDITIDSKVELIPIQTPKTVVEDVDEVEAIVTALENRPEFAKAKYVVDISQIREELARHEKLPELDALARYSFNSHGNDITDAIGLNQWDENNSWVVGLEFKWPIGNSAAKALYRKRLSENKQARSEVQREMDRIKREVKQAIYEIKLAKENIGTTGRAKAATEMVVKGEFARFELGKVTNEELLRAQDLLAGASQNHIRAIIDYNIALSALARAQGVLGHGLSIEGIETR